MEFTLLSVFLPSYNRKHTNLIKQAPSGTTVLHKAAEFNAPEHLVKSLISKGLDPNKAILKKGFTPVHFAIQSNSRPTVLEILVKSGADVNRVDDVSCLKISELLILTPLNSKNPPQPTSER